MKILVGCEYSGVVREAFAMQGHDAWSCDILPTEVPGQHYQGDVLDIIGEGWDMAIFHPPCTYITNSGVRWLYNKDGSKNIDRWEKMEAGAKFFRQLLDAPIEKIAIENPIPHKYALEIIGRKYDCPVQPWQHGHGETKATCFWLKNLPNLSPTNVVEGREQRIWKLPPSADRWKERSKTFPGIAKAMAAQWDEPICV